MSGHIFPSKLQTSRAWTVAIVLLLLSLHSSEPFRILSGNVPITWSENEARLTGDWTFHTLPGNKTMAAAAVCVSDLLASAFTSSLGLTVLTYDQYQKEKEENKDNPGACFEPLDIDRLFKVSHL